MFNRFCFGAVAASVLAFAASPPADAASMLSSSAYGLSADLSLLHVVTVTAGPFSSAGGTAPGPYSQSATLASVSDTLALGTSHQSLGTGVLNSSASSPYPGALTATATATVNDLNTELALLLGPAVLTLGATTVTSTSSVSDPHFPSAVGSSDIEGLTVSGSALQGAVIDGSLYAHAAPNTVLFNLGGLEIILNQQIPSGDGVNSAGMQTNAIVVEFTNFLLGTGILSGDIIVSHSQADITGAPVIATPEPASWAMMLLGFGVVGGFARARKRLGAI